jgi:hypothetical protein
MWKMVSQRNDIQVVKGRCFFSEMPNELLMEIFKCLGPASRRILGATNSQLYNIWKSEHYEKPIRVHCDESPIMGELIIGNDIRYETALSPYLKIIMQWMSPEFLSMDNRSKRFCTHRLLSRVPINQKCAQSMQIFGPKPWTEMSTFIKGNLMLNLGKTSYKADLRMNVNRILEFHYAKEDYFPELLFEEMWDLMEQHISSMV